VDNLVFEDGFITLDCVVNTMSPLRLSSCVLGPREFPQALANLYGVIQEDIHKFMLRLMLPFRVIKQHDLYYPHHSRPYSYSDSDD
jgi:hypothetical protein